MNVPRWVSIFFSIVAFAAASRLFRVDKDAQSAKDLNTPSFTVSIASYKVILGSIDIGFLIIGLSILSALILAW